MACIKGIQRILTWSIMLLNTGVTPRTEICGNPIPRIPSNLFIEQRLKEIITTVMKINTITTKIKSHQYTSTSKSPPSPPPPPLFHLAATKEMPGSWVASAKVWSLTHTWARNTSKLVAVVEVVFFPIKDWLVCYQICNIKTEITQIKTNHKPRPHSRCRWKGSQTCCQSRSGSQSRSRFPSMEEVIHVCT